MKLKIYILIFIFFIFYQLNSQIDSIIQSKINYQANKFKYLLEMLYKYSIDTFEINKVSDQSFSKLFTSVHPQSLYFNPQEYLKIDEQNRGTSHGIGIDYALLNDTLTIIKVIPNSPADSNGMLVGDKLLFIDGTSVVRKLKSFADSLIKKTIGTSLNIIVRRFEDNTWQLREFFVKIQDYTTPTIPAAFIFPKTKIGYTQISYFSDHTDEELTTSLQTLRKQGMQELVIDLRGNVGGVVESAINCLNLFFTKNTKLVEIKSKMPELDTVIYCYKDGQFVDTKLIVLIDKQSASASEIFAGAVQDNDRGLIIGEQSYGKGTIQKMWRLPDSSGFRITVAEYCTPLGRPIQKNIDTTNKVQLDVSSQLTLDESKRKEIEQQINKLAPYGYAKTYTTKKNRIIFAFGGIFPDLSVSNDTMNTLTRVLLQRGMFLEFAMNLYLANKNNYFREYKNNFANFVVNFKVSDDILETFKQLSLSRNIWNDNYYQQDKEYFKVYIKSLLAYLLWQDGAYKLAFTEADKTMTKAIQSFENYNKILNIK